METEEAGSLPLLERQQELQDEPMEEGPEGENASQFQPMASLHEEMITNGDSDYDCDECGLRCGTAPVLIEHMETHGFVLSSEEEVARLELENVPEPLMRAPEVLRPITGPVATFYFDGRTFRCLRCNHITHALSHHVTHAATHTRVLISSAVYICRICLRERFITQADLIDHEESCEDLQLLKRRMASVEATGKCEWCPKQCISYAALAGHILVSHSKTLAMIRKNVCMVGELLPFRCSACRVGFESPDILTNHFRTRELLGIPCRGELIIYDYQIMKETDSQGTLPSDCEDEGDIEDEDDECGPHDPPPYLPPMMDVYTLTQCQYCTEMWPVAQMVFHTKFEHPVQFLEHAPFRCKKCKLYSFYCKYAYAEHWETCSPDSMGPIDRALSTVACRRVVGGLFKKATNVNVVSFLENAGNEIRRCRFCPLEMSPPRLMKHMKESHPLRHFTNAPYPCLRCGDVGFYAHAEYAKHAEKCDGSTPLSLVDDFYAIVLNEIWTKEHKDADFSTYRSCYDDYRKNGTLTAFEWKQVCLICPTLNRFEGSLRSMACHVASYHVGHPQPLECAGCGAPFHRLASLIRHAELQNKKGNAQCFGMARAHMNSAESIIKVNLQSLRVSRQLDRDSVLVRYWKEYLKLKKYRLVDPSMTKGCPLPPSRPPYLHHPSPILLPPQSPPFRPPGLPPGLHPIVQVDWKQPIRLPVIARRLARLDRPF